MGAQTNPWTTPSRGVKGDEVRAKLVNFSGKIKRNTGL